MNINLFYNTSQIHSLFEQFSYAILSGRYLDKRTCLSWSQKIILYNDHPDIVTDIIVSMAYLRAVVVCL